LRLIYERNIGAQHSSAQSKKARPLLFRLHCISSRAVIRFGCIFTRCGAQLLRLQMPFSGKQMAVIVGLSAVTSFFVVPMIAKWLAPKDLPAPEVK
jgi:hypothetical protein